MRVVLSGGGTGGHIYPALAVASQCAAEYPDAEFLYIGGQKGLESSLVPKENIPFEAIDISGFRRKLSIDNIKTIVRFLKGVSTSKKLLRQFKPDVVIGTGGYVCGPVVYAASKLGIPSIIHEQNAVPGLTNRFLSKYVSTVAVSFEGTESSFSGAKNIIYTGNPRATTVHQADKNKGYASLDLQVGSSVVLVVGGSRGAKAINEAMIAMAPYVKSLDHIRFVYVTGDNYYKPTLDAIVSEIGQLPSNLQVLPYVHNMPEVLACTSLIVNRAGASFLAEITSLGIPSILIPSPNVTNNHQEKNARTLEKSGAAEVILEPSLTGELLFASIERIMKNPSLHTSMSAASQQLGKPESAHLIVEEMTRLTQQ
ncbi:undecaprenyldiphospho-muramoylpentapeptide beta-N-acetylglucosaminyltransferase [Paenibacillus segetis]|uniref:UDP-N-acetylglucosamine--N-acetylmuramyl-(pentapeptide) pyrophosphoryl-undecaprenol N-acetylglucosamine transferase n=1 Tax=Paenibacillus segetis TaxID=1325360 RepID=A0ABQ1YJC6_9BACL|nr:undecaprenyldiphospho-muramoylpentapeptide beta-N-acetylglucosaminyltransferase [Paenibacillus segetis]GGH26349.1 UDP-N-acetylglucosamine--N-acetylmuramyl-(pentapeptide) pyrophosphoryl-undecaprenol N-acetylglucosamine transferase 1 [Paenibacillus segetis]